MERRLAAVLAADMVGYSRLMEQNEAETLSRQKSRRDEIIDPAIAEHRGRIVKTTGDGLIAEFAAAQDAVRCAIAIQVGLIGGPADQPEPDTEPADMHAWPIQYRIGINIGDVVFEDDDIFGDGVNVAARLEGLAPPGGLCVSDVVHQVVLDRIGVAFRDMGSQRVKNISRPIRVWQWTPDSPGDQARPEAALKQRVQFCTSRDGTQIAYASVGEGPAILKAPSYLTHIEYEWTNTFWGPFLARFAHNNRLVRFDQRGNGLSDWEIQHVTADAMVEDMESVVAASKLETFALIGISQGAAFSVRYAARHPDKVACLILFGGYMRGRLRRANQEDENLYNAATSMMREGWGSTNPVYRQFFTSGYLPDALPQIKERFDELQRVSGSAENVVRIWEMNARLDTSDIATTLDVPTLVIHSTGDRMVPVAEGHHTARLIPGAQFVELPSNNHVVVEGEPAFDMFFEEVQAFLKAHGPKP